jgi:hypothetical protein
MSTHEQKLQAWTLIDQACALLNLTRDQHVQIQQAMAILKPDENTKP